MIWPNAVLPWPVEHGLINYGYCKPINRSIVAYVTLQVNPWTHFFAGTIPRMINGYDNVLSGKKCSF